jgi:hypothetical protein
MEDYAENLSDSLREENFSSTTLDKALKNMNIKILDKDDVTTTAR